MKKQTRYIVFECVKMKPHEGASSWTIAHRDPRRFDGELLPGTPACFSKRIHAREWVRDVHSKRLGWWHGKPNQRPMVAKIVKCEL